MSIFSLDTNKQKKKENTLLFPEDSGFPLSLGVAHHTQDSAVLQLGLYLLTTFRVLFSLLLPLSYDFSVLFVLDSHT